MLDDKVVASELMTTAWCPHNCSYCLSGDTKILMKDLSWKPIKNIEVGDEIVGAKKKDDTGYMEIQPTTVEATNQRVAETVEMVTEDTSIKVTTDHKFYRPHRGYVPLEKERDIGTEYRVSDPISSLGQPFEAELNDQYRRGWMYGVAVGDGSFVHDAYYNNKEKVQKGRFSLRVQDRKIINRFADFGEDLGVNVHVSPWEEYSQALLYKGEDIEWLQNLDTKKGDDWYRGFLGGFFDAEGSFDGVNLRMAQKEGEELSLAKKALDQLGIQYKDEAYKSNGVHDLLVNGGRDNILRFFSMTNPVLQRKKDNLFGGVVKGAQEIEEVNEQGEDTVYDIRTGTHNFIANGLLAHNCYIPKSDMMKDMHEEHIENLDKLLGKSSEVFENMEYLGLWGTEPLLTLDRFSPEEIDKTFPNLDELSFSTSLLSHVDTLVTFINDSKEYDWDIEVQVSVDGPFTDENRVEGATKKIKENLTRLVEDTTGSFKLKWKGTITPENMEDLLEEGGQFYFDYFDELEKIVNGTEGDHCHLLGGRAPTLMVPGRYSSDDGKLFARFLEQIHEAGHDTSYTHGIMDLLKDSYYEQILKRPHTATCSGGDTQFGFDGENAHICHRTFYLDKQEYVDSIEEQDQEENWDVSHFKSGTVKQLQEHFIADTDRERDIESLQYALANYHEYWELKLQMDKSLMIELADVGQIDKRYGINGEKGARDFLAVFLNSRLSCPVESVMNTNSLYLTPASLIRMFGNGAMQELEGRAKELL